MAPKRKAQEAFGKPKGQLSAFAAARLLKQSKTAPAAASLPDDNDEPTALAASVATVSYDGHHSDGLHSGAVSGDETPVVTPARAVPSIRLSTFHPTLRNVPRDNNECIELRMSTGETAVFVGEYDLEVLSGTLTIYGATFSASSTAHRVYAPGIQALPVITARNGPSSIRVSSVKSSLSKLEKLSPLFRNAWTIDKKGRSFAFLETTSDDPLERSLSTLETDAVAQKVLTQITGKTEDRQGTMRAMVVGPKSSGKSTFNRQLCNALLTRKPHRSCLYLDLDPGQPEFGPPGQIGLIEVTAPILGPSFTHQASQKSRHCKLIASHTLAATSFKDDPDHYVACLRELASTLASVTRGKPARPLIINSCGWVTGLGAAVLSDIYNIIRVTDSVLIDGTPEALVTSAQESTENWFKIPRAPVKPSSRSPAELRAIQTMAYFHSRPIAAESPAKWAGRPISRLRPWIVSYGQSSGVSAIMSYGQSIPAEFLNEVLDGSLVAIVAMKNDTALRQALSTSLDLDSEQESTTDFIARTPESLPYVPTPSSGYIRPLDPRHSTFVSLALVRGIDTESKELHLITPLSSTQIAAFADLKIVLVRGGFDAPEWAYLEDLYAAEKGSEDGVERPWVTRKEPLGIEGAVWRLRHPPMASQMAIGR